MMPPEYNTLFSIILPKDREDLFYLNMRVFHLVPPEKGKDEDGSPMLIWCAVYSQTEPVSTN